MFAIQTSISFSAAVFFIFEVIVILNNDLLNKREKLSLSLAFLFATACCLSEWSAMLLERNFHNLVLAHKILKMLELALVPCIPFCFFSVLTKSKRAIFTFLGLIIAYLILHILSAFKLNVMFTVSAQNVYTHGPWYLIHPVACALSILAPIIGLIKFASKPQYVARYVVALPMLFMVYLVLMQCLMVKNIKIYYINAAIVLALSYEIYMNIALSTDSLTKLLNRQSYETRIRNIKKSCTIINLDLNNFKAVNDTYGHSKGDEVLRIFAGCIKRVYSKNGYCYRIGGDEFCVILTKNTESVGKFSRDLKALMAEKRKLVPVLPTFSAGYAKYSHDSQTSLQDAIDFADQRMYKYKALKGNGRK